MHKQLAESTMRNIEQKMSPEKKQELENIKNEVIDSFFKLRIGRDTYKEFVDFCFNYWQTYFDLKDITVVLDPDMPLTNGSCNAIFREIVLSSHINDRIKTIKIAPQIFLTVAHECAHLHDKYNRRSFSYDPITYKTTNAEPVQQGVRELRERLLKQRAIKLPQKPELDKDIISYSHMIYLNMRNERYAREFHKKAYDVFQQAVNEKYNNSRNQFNIFQNLKMKSRVKTLNKIINDDNRIRGYNDYVIPYYLNDPQQPFAVLYNELLPTLPQKVEDMKKCSVFLQENSSLMKGYEQYCAEILNLQFLPQFYNQEIIDKIKPTIMSLPQNVGNRLQSLLLIANHNTTKQEVVSYVKQAAIKNEPLNPLLRDYFKQAFIDVTYDIAQEKYHSPKKSQTKSTPQTKQITEPTLDK